MKDMKALPKNWGGQSRGCAAKGWVHTYDAVDKRLNVPLVGAQPQPDGAHHDGQAEIHGNADPVCDVVAVAFDAGAMQEGEDLGGHRGVLGRVTQAYICGDEGGDGVIEVAGGVGLGPGVEDAVETLATVGILDGKV